MLTDFAEYYTEYVNRYESDGNSLREGFYRQAFGKALKIKAAEIAAEQRPLVRVLDIGSGDFSQLGWSTQPPEPFASSDAEIRITTVDPFHRSTPYQFKVGNTTFSVTPSSLDLEDWLNPALNHEPFDLITSFHGLYGVLERIQMSPQRKSFESEYLRVFSSLLPRLGPLGALIFVHSSQHSTEKKIRFDTQHRLSLHLSKAVSERLRRFDKTDAESLLRVLSPQYLVNVETAGGLVNADIKLNEQSFRNFTSLFFRITQEERDSDIDSELGEALFRSWNSLSSKRSARNPAVADTAVLRLPHLMKHIEVFPTLRAAVAWDRKAAVHSSLAAAEPLPLASREYYLDRIEAGMRSIQTALGNPTVLNGTVNIGAGDRGTIIDIIEEQVENARRCLSIDEPGEVDPGIPPPNTDYLPMTVLYPLIHQAQYDKRLASSYPRMLDATRLHSSLCRAFLIEDEFPSSGDRSLVTSRLAEITHCPMVFQQEHLLQVADFQQLLEKHRPALKAAWTKSQIMATTHLPDTGLTDCLIECDQMLRKRFWQVMPELKDELAKAWKIFNEIFYFDPHIDSEEIFYYYLFVRRNVGRQLLAVGHWSTQINRPAAMFLIFNVEKNEGLDRGIEPLTKLGAFVESAAIRSGEYDAAMRSARAAIMSRNLSHNVGSHTLANPRLYESLDMDHEDHDNARRRLGLFHSYTQGRLDFMARAMSASNERPEPLFFVGDVLSGFFRQGVLLDTLVEDNGFPAAKMGFRVEMLGADDVVVGADFKWDPLQHRYATHNKFLKDDLVGVPGGGIGCHALYAFLENCLRNAVKYGLNRNDGSPLLITLRLDKCRAGRGQLDTRISNGLEDAWILSISDNVSADKNRDGRRFTVTHELRQHINTPLISDVEGGKLTPYGHGIQEMKVCAEVLAGGDAGLRFPSDEEIASNIHVTGCDIFAEYKEYQTEAKDNALAIATRQALRCYSSRNDKGERFLVYNLLLPSPVLLGLVTLGTTLNASLPDFVRRFDSLDSLAKTGAHFGLILDSGGEGLIEKTLEDIARLHPALPFRLMVLTPRAGQWESLLEKRDAGGFARPDHEAFTYGKHIPLRRLRTIGASDEEPHSRELLNLLTGGDVNASTFDYLGSNGWDAIALRVYDAWLRSYKPLPKDTDSWKLCIGFEHGGAKWTELLQHFSTTSKPSPCISIHVGAGGEGRVPTLTSSPNSSLFVEGKEGLARLRAKEQNEKLHLMKQILAFDNHGEVFPAIGEVEVPLSASARFYQKMGLKDSLTLFQTLESPPLTPFSFAWFAYSLAEGALTRVAILDERVGQATLGEPAEWGQARLSELQESAEGLMFKLRERKYHKAGLFPLLTFRRRNQKGSKTAFISKSIEESAHKTLAYRENEARRDNVTDVRREWNDFWEGVDQEVPEGLTFNENDCKLGAAMMENNERHIEPLNDVDVLVIHEGVTDILEKDGLWKPHGEEIWFLYSAAPSVVRTSGRGREARHLRDFVPFLEFSELSENTYQNLNKYALCKALLGTVGNPDDLPPNVSSDDLHYSAEGD